VLSQADADERWRYYEQLSGVERTVPHVNRPELVVLAEMASPAGSDQSSDGDVE
jgi:hypothetical protein